MQIREDFITNSSTTNYMIIGKLMTPKDVTEYQDKSKISVINDEGHVYPFDEWAECYECEYDRIFKSDVLKDKYDHNFYETYYLDYGDEYEINEVDLSTVLKGTPLDNMKIIYGSYCS
jgi:hypothetical protein